MNLGAWGAIAKLKGVATFVGYSTFSHPPDFTAKSVRFAAQPRHILEYVARTVELRPRGLLARFFNRGRLGRKRRMTKQVSKRKGQCRYLDN